MISPAQCRAARGLLKWSQRDLAKDAGIAQLTVVNFENEKTAPHNATSTVLQQAFESAGVEFIDANGGGPGLRLKGRTD